MRPAAIPSRPDPKDAYRKFLGISIPAFLLIYALVGFGQKPLGLGEPYPLASWTMYSVVPNLSVTYRLNLKRVGKKILEPPVPYSKAGDLLPNRPTVISIQSIRKFGVALKGGEVEKARRYRELIEKNLLPPDSEYEITEQRFWALEKWRYGRFTETTIATFRSDGYHP